MATPHPNRNELTLFWRLPVEIRCMIWTAMCEPRTVELMHEHYRPNEYLTCTGNPLALDICQESRNAVINAYPLCFGSIWFPARTRFNFQLDTLYIDERLWESLPNLFSLFRDNEINNLQHIALDQFYITEFHLEHKSYREGLRRALKTLKALKEVQIVFGIEDMASNTSIHSCGEEHQMELYHGSLPAELDCISIDSLPEKIKDTVWDGSYCAIYGWRRCFGWQMYTKTNAESDSDSIISLDGPGGQRSRRFIRGILRSGLDFETDESDESEEGTMEGESEADDIPSDTEEEDPSDATLITGSA